MQKRTLIVGGALVAALAFAGTTGAVAGNLIGSKDIKNNSVQSKDIKNGGVRLVDINDRAEAKLKGQAGTNGVDGKDGLDGAPGVDGDDGAPGVDGKDGKDGKDATFDVETVTVSSHGAGATATCPEGTTVVGGGAASTGNGWLVYSKPTANGWTVKVKEDADATAFALCVS